MVLGRSALVLTLAAAAAVASGCAASPIGRDEASTVPAAPSATTAWIDWATDTLTLIQPGGGYGRILRLDSGELLCGFDLGGRIHVRHSRDEGKTWQPPILVAEWRQGSLTNTELLQLRRGALLCFYNERPHGRRREPEGEAHPFAISLARSEDGGRSWQAPVRLYTGGVHSQQGCWEPAAIQLPSGEVQLYFANESPYPDSDEQEITLLRSHDGGRRWSAPERVSFRAGFRDGMPVPLLLEGGRGIALAIEDNGLSGNFKPVIIFTPLEDNWRSGCVGGDSPRRWSALATPLPPPVYAGAPYLRRLPSGETLLSFQQSDSGDLMKDTRMVVCIGDAGARHFARPSHPFPQAPGIGQLWNSLFVKDARTVTALSTTTINGTGGLWSMDGHLRRTEPKNSL